MRLFTRTIWIDRPPEAVFDFFIDLSQASSWRQYVRTMTPVEPGPLHAGSKIAVTMDIAGEDYSFVLEVLAIERPGRWRHRTNEVDYRGFVEYRFDPEASGTRVTMTFDVTPAGWYGWLGLPIVLMGRRRSYRQQLPQLKHAMETPSR
jgi:uncharacterized protein YndB with AHSA1/START domain